MSATLVFPHQLFENHPALSKNRKVYLIEDPLYFGTDSHWDMHFHKKKLILHRASMKAYEKALKLDSYEVCYVEFSKGCDTADILRQLSFEPYSELYLCDPVDDVLSRRLKSFAKANNIKLQQFDSPNFLSSEEWLNKVLDGKKPFMANFYKAQRKRMNILMESNGISPVGGKWSYDEDNRKKLPKKQAVPEPPSDTPNDFVKEAQTYVKTLFPKAPGMSHGFAYPVDRKGALTWLHTFFEERFHLFGDYEDAIHSQHRVMFHSVITPSLNIGLLSPQEIVDEALKYAKKHNIPLNTVEGFIRQIIGWREFMRAMYLRHGVEQRNGNFWKFTRDMPKSFYDGTTGVVPIDETIHRVLEDGYCHHIERLMLLGNFMLICRIHPTAVYKWFMELFIDAYDWVMVPNVYGMSQFADGGIFTTKPYLSGSNYVKKMSDYKNAPWCQTWDGLFWSFISDYKEVFAKNHRMSRMVWMYEKMPDEKKNEHRKNADSFLTQL